MTTLYYILDPMCSWCYAFSPTFKKILNSLNKQINIVYVMGGLAPHCDDDMPEDMQHMLQDIWKKIETDVGTKFNFDFWTQCKPRRSTYLSCQACIAARAQNKEALMIKAIQKQYYQKASNPSDKDTLKKAAKKIGLNMKEFSKALTSEETIRLLEKDLEKRRALHVNSFPSLVLEHKDNLYSISIDFKNYESIINQIETYCKN